MSVRYATQSLSLGLAPVLADAVHVFDTSSYVRSVFPHSVCSKLFHGLGLCSVPLVLTERINFNLGAFLDRHVLERLEDSVFVDSSYALFGSPVGHFSASRLETSTNVPYASVICKL